MFNNLINRNDFVRLAEKLLNGRIGPVLGRIFRSKSGRVARAWDHTEKPPINWWDIPAVRRRWNLLVSGDEEVDHFRYFTRKYFGATTDLLALSPGCGRGEVELQWARQGVFRRIEGYDLSAARIRYAREAAAREGLEKILHFEVGNIYKLDFPEARYDVVIFEGALHHFAPVDEILRRVHRILKPDGYLFINEFVGPARFQWCDRQLEAVNGLLAILPARYRVRWQTGRIKKRVHRPGRLWMYFSDPSEAVQSDRILSALDRYFTPLEVREFGGTVLNLLFSEIAQNFLADDEETRKWLDLCFAVEDRLLKSGELKSDYLMGIYRKREI